jgi:hypothetical protein
MSEDRLTALLGICIVPEILAVLSISNENYAEELERFYDSKLFTLLSDKETALWHLSPATLAQMYNDEKETGSFAVPEEQS